MARNMKKLTGDEIQSVLSQIEDYLNGIEKQWADNNDTSKSWWKINRARLVNGTQFIIHGLDGMIQWIEDLLPSGQDKKASVTLMASRLFDSIVAPAFPIWLKPLVPIIKEIIINIVISKLVDFIVAKYNTGIWNKEVTDANAPTV